MPKEQPSNRRSEILRAAENLMSTKGLNGVTTRQISMEVNVRERCNVGRWMFNCWRAMISRLHRRDYSIKSYSVVVFVDHDT